ncbi:MAG: UDP-N-acetylmuramoyl-L-alanyl-D-glutamate--2,6-diaminopimelate ligase, partial [Alistipes sp.]|nr:UDP-N-acetylmuramoyl-L-alanyl-D-glutamate--2,6-diaminopimelate ligase [Alistipes sp.]
MKRLSNILSSTEFISFTASSDVEIHALQYDSRKVEAGDCFFAVRGTQTDGHEYI